ncbi:MAG TPA: hypothetical protein VF763_08420 [Candidatus Limnocylindrales bacterium]
MSHPETILALIQEERSREIARAERLRSLRTRNRSGTPPAVGAARRQLGQVFLRLGAWLVLSGTPALRH